MHATIPADGRRQRRAARALRQLAAEPQITAVSPATLTADPAGGAGRDLACRVDVRCGRIHARVHYGMHLRGGGAPEPGLCYLPGALISIRPITICDLQIGRLRIRVSDPDQTGPLWQALAAETAARLRATGERIDSVLASALERHDPATPHLTVVDTTVPAAATVTNLEVIRQRRARRRDLDNQPA